MEVYKITLKIEIAYNNTISYEGKDLALAAALITISQNKLKPLIKEGKS
jgi:hypothetical protein